MIAWQDDVAVYLHRLPVDFRKAINGLIAIVEQEMQLPLFERSLFVFCNKRRTQLKVLYWDNTGFVLWQKRLEKDKFKWPRQHDDDVIAFNHEQWLWLLRGVDVSKIKPHKTVFFQTAV